MWLSNLAMSRARRLGQWLGCELVVEVSDHSIEVSMEVPDKSRRAWDSSLWKNGQLYLKGYANPIKPVPRPSDEPGEDDVDVETSEVPKSDGGGSVGIEPSWKYKEFMAQKIISQLLNPQEEWRKIVYGIIALGALQFLTMILVLYATGSF